MAARFSARKAGMAAESAAAAGGSQRGAGGAEDADGNDSIHADLEDGDGVLIDPLAQRWVVLLQAVRLL